MRAVILQASEAAELRALLGEVAASLYAEPELERGEGGYCNVCLAECGPSEPLQHADDCPLPRVLLWQDRLTEGSE